MRKYKHTKSLIWIFSSIVACSLLITGIAFGSVGISNNFSSASNSSNDRKLTKNQDNRSIGYESIAKFKLNGLDFELQKTLYDVVNQSNKNQSSVNVINDKLVQKDQYINIDVSNPNNNQPKYYEVIGSKLIPAKQKTNHTNNF